MKNFAVTARLAALGTLAFSCLALWGCPNPNDIGVQQYGTVKVTCIQASNNQPVAGALVAVGINTQTSNASGVAVLTNVPIGQQTIKADAPGLHGEMPVAVTVGKESDVTVSLSP